LQGYHIYHFVILNKYDTHKYIDVMASSNNISSTERGDPSQIPKGEDIPAEVQKVVREEA
jgi:hypothetical protein